MMMMIIEVKYFGQAFVKLLKWHLFIFCWRIVFWFVYFSCFFRCNVVFVGAAWALPECLQSTKCPSQAFYL